MSSESSLPNSPAEIRIDGKLQFDTAVYALENIDLSMESQEFLETLQTIQSMLDDQIMGIRQHQPFYIRMRDSEKVQAIRADLLTGLESVASREGSSPRKIAARALLELIDA